MSLLVSDAFADATTTAAAAVPHTEGPFSLVMIAAIFILFYFMLIRPQNKRAKEHRQLISHLKVGDEVVTMGGILGKVLSVSDQYLKISISDGVEINIQKGSITSVLPKGTLKSL